MNNASQAAVVVEPFLLPAQPDTHALHFGFADWDGDGKFDLLVSLLYQEAKDSPWKCAIDWFGNTSATGEPQFAAPSRLLTIPAPWELNAFLVVDWDKDGRLDLVVSVSKNWTLTKDGNWSCESQFWLHRREGLTRR